jgi:cytochrome c oxidase assembly protein subunit 15
VQVVLGGLTVLLGLAPWTVTAHLLCGSAFCATLLWCSRNLAEHGSQERSAPLSAWVRALALGTGALVAVQIALGGWVSSHYAGLACHAFPTCDGGSFAPTLTGLVGVHVLHRLGAYAVAAAFILLVWATRGSEEPVARIARSGLRLVVFQLAVGIANVLLRLPPEVTALHSALAAALVLESTLLAREILLHGTERSVSRSPARAQALGTS